jgi:hypothetical protein
MRQRKPQVGNAGLEAGDRTRQDAGVVCRIPLARSRAMAGGWSLIAGRRIKARRRSRVLSGAATLFIGMLPAGPRRQTGTRFLSAQAGCIQLRFPAPLRRRSFGECCAVAKSE